MTMEFKSGPVQYLHVKLAASGFDEKNFAHPALVSVRREDDKVLLVFSPEDINDILRAIMDYAPNVDVLETGLYPTPGPTSGYRLKYGRLRIVCPGEGIKPLADEIVLETDFSFGSGFHPTTKLSVLLLEELYARQPASVVFDLGTGSGVLALCAAKLGASRILAADIDERAVWEARKNVVRNAYQDRILVVKGTLSCARPNFFDLLLANLTIGTILTLGPSLAGVLKPKGAMILSGFTKGQVNEVAALFAGAQLRKTLVEEGWAAVWFDF